MNTIRTLAIDLHIYYTNRNCRSKIVVYPRGQDFYIRILQDVLTNSKLCSSVPVDIDLGEYWNA